MTLVPRLFLVLLLLSLPASAQVANVIISANARGVNYIHRVPAESDVQFNIYSFLSKSQGAQTATVDIEVPGMLLSILSPADGSAVCAGEHPIRCRITANGTANYSNSVFVTTRITDAGDYSASGTLSNANGDVIGRASMNLQVVDRPSLSARGYTVVRIDPGKSGPASAFVFNDGAEADATLTLTLPEGGTFTAVRVYTGTAECELEPQRVVCRTTKPLEYYSSFGAAVTVVAPERFEGGTFVMRAVASSASEDIDSFDNVADISALLVRHLLVRNTNDEGAESLRQALLDARQLCTEKPCTIDFRIVSNDPWVTIQPKSPLPEVWGLVKIDGATQTEFGGDTNPDGPEIEINGSLLDEGSNGLVLKTQCDVAVLDLAINGFPRHAIELIPEPQTKPCPAFVTRYWPYIEGNHLSGNERGIVMSARGSVFIEDNIISGNRRAGIFLGEGFYAGITKNRIVGNGASGIFLNVGRNAQSEGGGADIDDNVIADNGEWGVCRTPAGDISLTNNAIFGNTSQGIDIGLDNETPNRSDDWNSFPNKPVLFSAAYDPATNTTIVRGHIDTMMLSGVAIDVYASSTLSRWGYAQGERRVAGKVMENSRADFEIIAPGDLRGSFITATCTRTRIIGWAKPPLEQSHLASLPQNTSEFSNAIEVR